MSLAALARLAVGGGGRARVQRVAVRGDVAQRISDEPECDRRRAELA